MRRAYYDVGFMLDNEGAVQGLSLGYDRCGEHEWGINGLLEALGISLPEFPLGVADRVATEVPTTLRWQEFTTKPCDKRRKGYPTAMLSVLEHYDAERDQPVDVHLRNHEMQFHGDLSEADDRPQDNIAASWNSKAFSIQVRGANNIERLRQVHQAFLAKDIAVALPWAKAFFRGGLSFVIASRMPDDAKAKVLADDEGHKELHLAAKATGLEEVLKAAGKRTYAFSPSWFDGAKDEVIFFINPMDQKNVNHGWFTVQELTNWANGTGPVLKDVRLNAFADAPEQYDWTIRLLRGLNKAGIHVRYHQKFVWFDEAKTVPGLRVRVTRDSEKLLPSGDYSYAELMAKYAEPLNVGVTVA